MSSAQLEVLMHRFPRAAAAVVVGVLGLGLSPAYGLMIAMRTPAQRAVSADVVVVGKVTAIEKDVVEAQPFPNAPNKVNYKVAVVKIETNLAGAANITHIKIGFIPPAKPDPNVKPPVGGAVRPIRPIRGPLVAIELKEGQEMLFFLSKHPGGDFYIMPGMSPALEMKGDQGKKELEAVKRVTSIIADPMKGLKSDKADVRAETAAIMVMKYRTYPEFGGEVDQVAINADESKLILKALADAEWSQNVRPVPAAISAPNALQAFYQLGLTDKDGWKQPVVPRPKPGQPPVDFAAIQKKAFIAWLAGPGTDYVMKRIVPKQPK
jgi:hypothetical protein